MKCCVIGLGYIGLPTAAILANNGHQVAGIDINDEIVSCVNNSKAHIVEEGLQELLTKVVKKGLLKAYNHPVTSEVYLICVPTPLDKTKHKNIPEPDITYVIKAVKSIINLIKKNDLIIIESTCPIGTTEGVAALIQSLTGFSNIDISIAYCSERVIPGSTLKELVNNNRVIGGLTEKASILAAEFYDTFNSGEKEITDSKTAELVKLTENAFRDVNIAFANEISIICSELSIDAYELIKIANKHPRVNILNPSCGVGGHCISIDPWFIAHNKPKESKLIQTARAVNHAKTIWVVECIKKLHNKIENESGFKPTIGTLGLAYKPNVDDIRESPALLITSQLIKEGLNILPCEPYIKKFDKFKTYPLEEILNKSDIIVCLVAHKAFKEINLSKYNVLDFCGLIQ